MKFVIAERVNGDITGYVTAPYYMVSKDKSKAKVFDYGLDASLTAYAMKKQFQRDYIVEKLIDETEKAQNCR